MVDLLGNPNVPPANLFTPDFGQEPHLLVGRDRLMSSVIAGLDAGPRDRRFTTLLLGPRGSGKTVMLNAVRNAASESGWIVLPLDASTETLARFQRMLDDHVADDDPAPSGCSEEVLEPLRAARARANEILLGE